jgi:hypothetical protein
MRANLWKRLAVAVTAAAAFFIARPADAQGLIQGMGGVTKTADQNPFFAGLIGGKVGPIEIDGEFGRLTNIVPKRIGDAAASVGGGEVKAELPAWYGMGSIRLIAPAGPVQPFVRVGAGAARLHPQFSASDPDLDTEVIFGDGDTTKFLLGAGGGIRVEVSKVLIEGGYRYMRVFQKYRSDSDFNNDDVLVNVHMIYAGLGVRF